MGSIPELHATLQHLLDDCATEHGRSSRWEQRRGQMTASQFVQLVTFGFVEDPHATLGHLARVGYAVGAAVTPQAISQRMTQAGVQMMKGLVQDAVRLLVQADPVDVEVLQRFPGGVFVNDATQIAWHDDWASEWDGGGRAAALKMPTVIDLLHGTLQTDLIAARQHDSVTALANQAFPVGSVVIEDLGYLDGERMQTRLARQVATVVPYRSKLALLDGQGKRLCVGSWVTAQPHQWCERSVWWQGHMYRLIAMPVSDVVAERKRQGMRDAAQRHGRPVNPLTLRLAAWQVILTTLTPEQATFHEIGLLMRMRWQIELLFKLWKDEGKLDETRGFKPERIQIEFYAKVLGQLIVHWIILTTGWSLPDRSLVKMRRAIQEEMRHVVHLWRSLDALAQWCSFISGLFLKQAHVTSHLARLSTWHRVIRA
jgi:Transposase DDE domain